MATEVFNPTQTRGEVFRTTELHTGVLYKSSDEDGNIENYDTIYIKTHNGHVIFFEDGLVNEDNGTGDYYFVVAPQGTYVKLS